MVRSLAFVGATLIALACVVPACGSFGATDDEAAPPSNEAGAVDGSTSDDGGSSATDATSDGNADALPPVFDGGDAGDAGATIAACDSASSNIVVFDGDPGDYIHPGADVIVSATWSANVLPSSSTTPTQITINVTPAGMGQGLFWYLTFSSTQLGMPLTAQTYANAQRAGTANSGTPGLDVSGDGRGCNTLTGAFTITKVQVAAGGVVSSFTATFEQHCEGSSKALRGCVHYQQ